VGISGARMRGRARYTPLVPITCTSMFLFLNASIRIVEKPEPFADENGQPVHYFINTIKTKEGEVLVINSKDNYEEFEGQEGVVKLRCRSVDDAFKKDGAYYKGLSKLTLAGFTAGDELPAEDIT